MRPSSSLLLYALLFSILNCFGIVPQINLQTVRRKVHKYEGTTRGHLFLIVPQKQFPFPRWGKPPQAEGAEVVRPASPFTQTQWPCGTGSPYPPGRVLCCDPGEFTLGEIEYRIIQMGKGLQPEPPPSGSRLFDPGREYWQVPPRCDFEKVPYVLNGNNYLLLPILVIQWGRSQILLI